MYIFIEFRTRERLDYEKGTRIIIWIILKYFSQICSILHVFLLSLCVTLPDSRFISLSSSSSSIILMSLIEGRWLLFHPSGTWGMAVFVRSRGPETVINMAAAGAVRMIESTHTIDIISACFTYSSSVATLINIGPRAA